MSGTGIITSPAAPATDATAVNAPVVGAPVIGALAAPALETGEPEFTLADTPPRDRRLRGALRRAALIEAGTLTVVMPDGTAHRIIPTTEDGAPPPEGPSAVIHLKDPRALGRMITHGSLGIAEAYVDGLWTTPDLRALMALAAANEEVWPEMLRGRRVSRALSAIGGTLRPGKRRAPRDIATEYGLGREFFASWMDPTLSWSAGVFADPADTLETAQLRKIHRLCQTLRLSPGMRLLELGCGWGAFAEIAARDYGASVVGITLSPEQLHHATARIERAGLASRVELRLQDFRDVTGSFDRIASIEMLDKIGEDAWPLYFTALKDRLRKNGVAVLQVTTIADRLYEQYRNGSDIIQRHLFPGGRLPSKSRLKKGIARANLAWGEEIWFARDYAETLLRWQQNFEAAWPRIAGARTGRRPRDERFRRLWRYHLAYTEIGFRAGWTDIGQILIARNG